MYDPRLGRLTQADPILGNRPFKHYAYASNNPISRIDPMGTDDAITELKRWIGSLFDWRGTDPLYYAPGHRGWNATKEWAINGPGGARDIKIAVEIQTGGAIGEAVVAKTVGGFLIKQLIQGGVYAGEEAAYRGVVEGQGTSPREFLTDTAVATATGIVVEGTPIIAKKGLSKLDQIIEKWRNPFQRVSRPADYVIGEGPPNEYGEVQYAGGYNPKQNTIYVDEGYGHPQGYGNTAGSSPDAREIPGLTLQTTPNTVYWSNASPSLPKSLTEKQARSVQLGLEDAFKGKKVLQVKTSNAGAERTVAERLLEEIPKE
jgi:hypothetical protein